MKKFKKIWSNNFFRNYVLLLISFILIEVFFRLISELTIFSYSSLRIFIILNILSCSFSFIFSYAPKILAKIFNLIIVFVFSIYAFIELGFKNFLGVYASIQSHTQAGAVTSYILDFVKSFKLSYYILLIPFILLLLYYIFISKKIEVNLPKKKITKKIIGFKISQVCVIIVLLLLFYSTLRLDFMQNKLQATTPYDLFLKPNNPSLLVNDFGIIGFGLLDIREAIAPGEDLNHDIDYNPEEIPSNETEQIRLHTLINNEAWKSIIEEEKNNNLNTLNKYFISNDISTTNDYTGLFEGKNVIFIMVESGSQIMLQSEYYPNIARLYEHGWSFDNYYSPRNTCSTGNNEMSGMTGLYTIYNNCTANVYQKNTYFEGIFNLFNNKGYETSSYHNNYDEYYARTVIHKNVGSSKYYDINDLGIEYTGKYGEWSSDEDLITSYLKILDTRDTSKPFMNWITTVSSHQPYTDSSLLNNEYKDLFPKDYPEDIKSYMSKLKTVDNAIGLLLDGLEKRGLLEDTVIVMFADHYPYGLSKTKLSNVYGYDVTEENATDNVPFVIYNPSLEKENIKSYTAHVNTIPTFANLFNLDYDSRLYMGNDVLAEDYESLVIFDDASWKNEFAFYEASKNKIKYYTEKEYTEEEIIAINERVRLKLEMSSLAIRNNYFNYLNKALTEYNIKQENQNQTANENNQINEPNDDLKGNENE